MDLPYAPPQNGNDLESPVELERKMKFWKRVSWMFLALFIAPFMLRVIATAHSISKTFSDMGGIGDPNVLAEHIGEGLIAIASGMALSIPTLVVLIVSHSRFRSYRAKLRKFST